MVSEKFTDVIKADDTGSHLYQPAEIKALSLAIRKTGRPMLLSISPGPAPISEAEFFEKYAQMWRFSDDFWDSWKLLRRQFDYTRDWARYVGKNDTWPDADMLPLGKLRVTSVEGGGAPSKFTPDEQQTVITLWSIFRSPLIFGGDLPRNDPATTELITNEEVLAVDQKSAGGHEALARGDIRIWTAETPDSHDRYLAVFNLGDGAEEINFVWKDAGISAQSATIRDLWRKTDLGTQAGVNAKLAAHASLLYRLSDLR